MLSNLPESPVFTPTHTSPGEDDDERQCRVRKVAEARLWRLLQQRLYDPSAALTLKPLKMMREEAEMADADESILMSYQDRSIDSCQTVNDLPGDLRNEPTAEGSSSFVDEESPLEEACLSPVIKREDNDDHFIESDTELFSATSSVEMLSDSGQVFKNEELSEIEDIENILFPGHHRHNPGIKQEIHVGISSDTVDLSSEIWDMEGRSSIQAAESISELESCYTVSDIQEMPPTSDSFGDPGIRMANIVVTHQLQLVPKDEDSHSVAMSDLESFREEPLSEIEEL